MKQRVTIAVIRETAATSLLDTSTRPLSGISVRAFFDAEVKEDRALFLSEHVDFWSMGDTFERFLRPRKEVRHFEEGGFELYAIPRDHLKLRASARNEEERLLRNLLSSASTIYREISPRAWIFVLREHLGPSPDLIPDTPPIEAPQ